METQYVVDIIDDKHNNRVPMSQTDMTANDAFDKALGYWLQGKHVQVLAWTQDDGFVLVADYH